MANVRLFLSTVSAEFLSYRDRLRHLLTRPNVEVKVQEDFIVTGDETLEMLDTYIQGCDAVIHLVGDMTGAMAKPQSVAAIAARYPDLASRLPLSEFLQPEGPSLSYTQWEAWLALWHGKRLFIATPQQHAPRDGRYRCDPGEQALQQAHLTRLRAVARYPGLEFSSQDELAAGLLRSFVLDLLLAAERSEQGVSMPHNLPERATGSADIVGRDQALERLGQLLAAGVGPVLITGMDGVGKTALALHHLRQRLEHYGGGVVLLDGRLPLAGLVEQLEQFALVHFDLPVPDSLPPHARLGWLYSHWPGPQPVLLLVDELQDPSTLEAMGQGLPPRFRLLVTSRRQFGVAGQRVPLEPLGNEMAVALLEQLAERGAFSAVERRQAQAMAEEVGGLPLALLLLGRQLARDQDLEPAELLRALQQRGALARELQGSASDPLQARGLRTGFQLIWEGLSPSERRLGLLLAELPPTAVPWELLAPCCPPEIDPHDWQEARLGLEQQHLIERPLARLLQLHPLLHDLFAAEARAGEGAGSTPPREGEEPAAGKQQQERQERLKEALVPWLTGISDVLEARSRERQQRCLPLLEALARWPADRWVGATIALPDLARGRVLSGLGAYGSAQEALQTALHLTRETGGAEAAALEAGCLVALAGIARERGQLQEAETQCQQALVGLEAAGVNGAGLALERAEALNGLGLVLMELARPEAESVLREALELRQKNLGGAHRLVQISRCNLAMSLRRLEKAAEAEALYQQVLADLDDETCEVAVTARNNLSFLAEDAGQLERAHTLREEAVALAALALGENHPSRGVMLMNLGVVAEKLGRLDEAEDHYRQAAQLTAAAWGPNHPLSLQAQDTLEAYLAAPAPGATAEPPSDPADADG
jgi:tetratricopeptide (TPR) repeat protein